MSQQSLIWPLSVVTMALIVIIMALAAPPTSPSAAPLQQACEPGEDGYPQCQTQTAQAGCGLGNSAYPTCATETAAAGQDNDDDNNNDDDNDTTATPTQTRTNTADDDNDDPANTSTPTATEGAATRTPTEASLDEDEDDEATNTPVSEREDANETPTGTLLPDSEVVICVPSVPVFFEGQGPTNTALLLYFDGRPVGGATSDAQGAYRLQLIVGDERGGDYPVEVQVRGTREVVATETCRVPGATTTPTESTE